MSSFRTIRRHYLREISDTVRNYHQNAEEQVKYARKLFQLEGPLSLRRKKVNGDIKCVRSIKGEVEAETDGSIKERFQNGKR